MEKGEAARIKPKEVYIGRSQNRSDIKFKYGFHSGFADEARTLSGDHPNKIIKYIHSERSLTKLKRK
jgi:hypothetical protein